MPAVGAHSILRPRDSSPRGRATTTAAIGLIDRNPLTRQVSPELVLVDPEPAPWARGPVDESNGKVLNMSAQEIHEPTPEMGFGLEPPLSPPIVSGPGAQAPAHAGDALHGLPTPPPAIRPPEAPATESGPAAQVEQAVLHAVPTEPAELEVERSAAAPVDQELPAMAPPEEKIELEPVQPSEIEPLAATTELDPTAQTAQRVSICLVIRLRNGEHVEIGEFENVGMAKEGAREVVEQLTAAGSSTWPFYADRFICPDAIISVDVVANDDAAA
jgi:hypothetical protein